MSKKYVIEIRPEYEDSFKGLMLLGAKDSNLFVDTVAVEDLEELNSDYINEHFGDLQETAYQKGFDDAHRISEEEYQRGLEEGKKATWGLVADASSAEYQKGLNEAWECARKLFSSMADSDIEKAFPTEWNNGGFNALINLQPQEAIEKLKAYEKKQSDKIKVGDEVFNIPTKTKGILLEPETEHLLATVIVPSLRWRTINIRHANLKKTGKHYDIEKLLEAMKA